MATGEEGSRQEGGGEEGPAKKAALAKKAPAKKARRRRPPGQEGTWRRRLPGEEGPPRSAPRTPRSSPMTPERRPGRDHRRLLLLRTEGPRRSGSTSRSTACRTKIKRTLINADAKLKEVTKQAQVSMFELTSTSTPTWSELKYCGGSTELRSLEAGPVAGFR